MSANLILRITSVEDDPLGNLQLRYVNTVNTPIVSATWLDNGITRGDDYTLVFTNTGGVRTVTVDCLADNPYRNMSGITVVCDGVTVNKGIVPNVGLVFAAGADTGWTAKVTVGDGMDVAGSITAVFGFGVVEASTWTTGVRITAINVGDRTSTNSKIYSLPGVDCSGNLMATFVKVIQPHSSEDRHKLASFATKTLTFQDWKTGAGGKKTADLYVDGTKCIEDAIFDGSTVYEWGSGNGYVDGSDLLAGLQIVFCDTTEDPSAVTLTLNVLDGWDMVEFAPDVAGSPGTYANQDLTLTQDGQPTGTILANGKARLWARLHVPLSESVGPMRGATITTRGMTT